MQNRIYAFLMAGISTVGLISCSADKTKQDDWQVSAPTLKSASNSGTAVDLHSGFMGEVSADSQFDFSSNQPDQLAKVGAHSECSRSNTKSFQDREFSDSSSVAISALLPDDIAFSMSTEKVICQFSFRLANRAGSIRSFQTRPITIGNFKSLENFPIDGTEFTTAQLSSLDLNNIRKSANRLKAETSITALVCDKFENSRVRQKNQGDQEILQQLGESSIQLPAQPATLLEAYQDSRFTDTVQNCKLVVSNQARGQAAELITSSRFVLTFPASKPLITISKLENFTANTNLNGTSLVTIVVENLDPVPVGYQLNFKDLGFNADTFGVTSDDTYIRGYYLSQFSGFPVSGSLNVTVDGKFFEGNGMLTFEVPANGSTSIHLKISSALDCPNRNIKIPALGTMNGEPPNCHDWKSCTAIWKLNFHVRTQIKLSRLTQWNGNFAITSKTRDESVLVSPFDLQSVSTAESEMATRNFPKIQEGPVSPEIANFATEFSKTVHVCN